MTERGLHIVWFLILIAAACERPTPDHTHHSGHGSKDSIDLVARPVNQVVLSSQKTIKPIRTTNQKKVAASGYITFDERRNNKVAVRISGRIEKLYIKYNFQYVKRGQTIVELYSPELSTYQEEYLFLLKSHEDSLAEKAKEKLALLGLSESQILQIKKTGVVSNTISITSLIDGFIRFSSDPVSSETMNSSTSAMNPMAGGSSQSSKSETTSVAPIQEGMYVSKGQTLFVVNDCKKVWAILSADISAQTKIKKGDSVILSSEVQAGKIKAKVDLVEPLYQEKQRFTQMRIYLDNSLRSLKVNSLISAEFLTHSSATLTIPASSVFDLGTRKVVWVKTGATANGIGLFEPKIVTVGFYSNNIAEVLDGLDGNEEIALDAGYMLDREGIVNDKP